MKCRKMRKIYKYTDGQLSEHEAKFAAEHTRNCPVCAAEADSLERMRSFLSATGRIEMPDVYWDTYWDRLEKKLPDKPSPVTLTSRILDAAIDVFRRPAILGRVAVYVILLVLLIYAAPDRPVKVALKPPAAAQKPAEIAAKPLEFREDRKSDEAEVPLSEQPKASSGRGVDYDARTRQFQPSSDRHDLAFRIPKAEKPLAKVDEEFPKIAAASPPQQEALPSVELAKPAAADATAEALQVLQDDASFKDEYAVADNHFKNGQYPEAILAYQNFIKVNLKEQADGALVVKDETRVLKAAYQIGVAYYQIGNYSEALSYFTALTDATDAEAPAGSKTLQFHFLIAGAETAKSKAPAAKPTDTLKEVESAPVSGDRAEREREAKAKGAETSRGTATLARIAQQEVRATTETHEELISRAMFKQAQSYEHLGKREEALSTYRKYVEKYPQGEYASQVREKIAQMAR